MTKLMEWLSLLGILFTIWFSLITNKIENSFVKDHYTFVLYSPVVFVLLFGLYAFSVVMYRVFTFNNCEEAAAELQKDIQEAKADLTKLGFKFKQTTT